MRKSIAFCLALAVTIPATAQEFTCMSNVGADPVQQRKQVLSNMINMNMVYVNAQKLAHRQGTQNLTCPRIADALEDNQKRVNQQQLYRYKNPNEATFTNIFTVCNYLQNSVELLYTSHCLDE